MYYVRWESSKWTGSHWMCHIFTFEFHPAALSLGPHSLLCGAPRSRKDQRGTLYCQDSGQRVSPHCFRGRLWPVRHTRTQVSSYDSNSAGCFIGRCKPKVITCKYTCVLRILKDKSFWRRGYLSFEVWYLLNVMWVFVLKQHEIC